MLFPDFADDHKPRFVGSSSRNLKQHIVGPKQLGLDEVDTVFFFVRHAFFGIEFELHAAPF
jgi:hypothetical protein